MIGIVRYISIGGESRHLNMPSNCIYESIDGEDYVRINDRGIELYVMKWEDGDYYLHRTGGLPAIIFRDGTVGFFEYGFTKLISDLGIDDMGKVMLVLKYTLSRRVFNTCHLYQL